MTRPENPKGANTEIMSVVIPGGTAHGGGDVAVFHVGSTRPQEAIELGHELKGAQFDILGIWRGTGMVTHMQFNFATFRIPTSILF